MLPESVRKEIITIIKQEVTLAIGCTEPIAVALAVAKLTELLRSVPDRIDVFLSANVLKNAMGVGIPGTGMVGLPIAIALGALAGKSEYGLEVLKDITPADVENGKLLVAKKIIGIHLKDDIDEKLYIEVVGSKNQDVARTIISGEHTRFVFLELNQEILLNLCEDKTTESEADQYELSFDKVCEFAIETPIDEIRFIKKTVEVNKAAAEAALKGSYGHTIGKTLANGKMGDSVYTHMLSVTAAACDARMAGAMLPVMSNSGSGNQGIAATLPVSVFAEESGKSDEELIRALALSHLMTIYIKQSLGRLSGLCGAMVATTGSACGVTYLM